MASNGCGFFGLISVCWKFFKKIEPPFQWCCDEHDLAYEQIENENDRVWADIHFKRCMELYGYKKLGNIFYVFIKKLGWITWITPWRLFNK